MKGSRFRFRGSWLEAQVSGLSDHGSEFKVDGSGFKAQEMSMLIAI